jgi:hypothetical protein
LPGQPIPVRLPDGSVREDIVYDISPAGMQLRCDAATAAIIHPLDEPVGAYDLPRVKVEMTLPVAEKNKLISVQCKLCFVRELPDRTISMGLQFEQFDGEVKEYFQKFIEESLEPPSKTDPTRDIWTRR